MLPTPVMHTVSWSFGWRGQHRLRQGIVAVGESGVLIVTELCSVHAVPPGEAIRLAHAARLGTLVKTGGGYLLLFALSAEELSNERLAAASTALATEVVWLLALIESPFRGYAD